MPGDWRLGACHPPVGAVHIVFAVIPKMKNVLYLVQEKCFGIKERSLPSKAAKVVEYYGLQ